MGGNIIYCHSRFPVFLWSSVFSRNTIFHFIRNCLQICPRSSWTQKIPDQIFHLNSNNTGSNLITTQLFGQVIWEDNSSLVVIKPSKNDWLCIVTAAIFFQFVKLWNKYRNDSKNGCKYRFLNTNNGTIFFRLFFLSEKIVSNCADYLLSVKQKKKNPSWISTLLKSKYRKFKIPF